MGIFDFFKKKKVDEVDNAEYKEDAILDSENKEELKEITEIEIIEDEEEDETLLTEKEVEDIEKEIGSKLNLKNEEIDIDNKKIIDYIKSLDNEIINSDEFNFKNEEESENLEEENLQADVENKEDSSEENQTKKAGFFKRIISGLDKTRKNILSNVENILKGFSTVDEELFEELEEVLITADIGVDTSIKIISAVRDRVKSEKITEVPKLKNIIVEEISKILVENESEFILPSPSILLVIGVNGVGKTTTIGKLASIYKKEGKNVLLAAADTFRAAAIDQLEVWGKRSGVEVIRQQEGSDPAAVVFDAVHAAKARKTDLLIVDTAGRLHNKKNLMDELAKIFRIIKREYEDAHIESLLVLDATTGQNALQQAKLFNEVADITGLVLTKLDGTAKGGVIIAIKNELKIPVRFIGVGEQIDDLQHFNAENFAKALFSENGESL